MSFPLKKFAVILFACAGIAASALAADASDRVVAAVGHEPVTNGDVLMVLAESRKLSYSEALDMLIERSLILQWAEQNGVRVTDQELDKIVSSIMEKNNTSQEELENALSARGQDLKTYRQRVRNQVIIGRAISAALAARVEISEDEIREAYDRDYPSRVMLSLSHILFKLPAGASQEQEDAVRNRASALLEKIRGGLSFAAAAREYSEDPGTAPQGGNLGTFAEGELMPSLEKAALSLQEGDVAGPIRSSLGIHLLNLTGRSSLRQPLEKVREKIIAQIRSRKERTQQGKWIRELKEKTYIEIFADAG